MTATRGLPPFARFNYRTLPPILFGVDPTRALSVLKYFYIDLFKFIITNLRKQLKSCVVFILSWFKA